MVENNSELLLTIQSLETRFGSRRIHRGLDLEVFKGELLVLFGGSGSGKSSLLRAIIGLDPTTGGSIIMNQQDLTHLNPTAWRKVRSKIGFSFQNGALFDSLTVGENLEYPLLEFSVMNQQERHKSVTKMLHRVGLQGIAELYPAELSGGMQKRVGIARTLMLDPTLILYDEPTAGLDPANTKIIANLMRELRADGKTGILVTHDVSCALEVGDRFAFLQDGKIPVVQTRDQVKKNPDPRLVAYISGDVE